MKFVGMIDRAETVTVDGYSNRKSATAAIKEMGRYIRDNVSETEGNAIIDYPEESLLSASESYGGYFLEIEEVPCASQYNEDTDEVEYDEANYYIVCRIVK